MRAVQGVTMRVPFGWTCAALVAMSAFGAPLAAQQHSTCDSCTAAARAASRDALEQARRALEDAQRALLTRRRALFDNDTSTAALLALRQAQHQLEMAQQTYEMQTMELMRTQAQEATRQTRIAMQRAREMERDRESRRGWLGISFESGRSDSTSGLPKIVAVAPGSPAERAGLEAGDVLVSLNGWSLRRGMPSFDRLLRPGTRIPVRIQRRGETKTVNVVVGRQPSFYMFRFNPDSMDMRMPDFAMPPMPAMPMPSTAPMAVPAMPSSPSSPPVAALAPSAPLSSFYFNGVSTIAGAQLWDVDQLKDYFHVSDGLLVLRVLPGTPADRAGLRSGDVIVSADGRTVTSIRTLERALERADEQSGIHTVQLDVVRKGNGMGVGLKW
ncbi:MAG TPA: PDZ domain-containing protein [Gemmatimonadaceae bacterium]|nr:PDZ domain-containing protein [Gemmatimonadaceae bacterium]